MNPVSILTPDAALLPLVTPPTTPPVTPPVTLSATPLATPTSAEDVQSDRAKDVVLQLNGISKFFGTNHVLRDVSLTVERGETICLLGPSGCGKSTLLRCVNWLEIPDAGSVHVSGKRMGVRDNTALRMSDGELARSRARIGMVFQHFALWPHLTVLENVMAAPLNVLKRPKAEIQGEALQLLERVGMLHKKDAYPAKLSGGQKQRVGIARALAIKPDILLFDEPTSALDPMLVGEVLNVMRTLVDEGATMIIVTHEMEFARQVASRIVFMDEGRIVEMAPPQTFFSAPQHAKAQQFLSRFFGNDKAHRDEEGGARTR